MDLLPLEMRNELSTYLPVNDLLKLRLLNREWKFAIDNCAKFSKILAKIERIAAKWPITNPTQMLNFIAKCRTLKVLILICPELDQVEFYNQLPDYQTTIETLRITETFELDLKFVFKMKSLKILSINQRMQFDFISQALNQLKKLDALGFRMADTFVTVHPKAFLLIKRQHHQKLGPPTSLQETTPLIFCDRDDLMDYLRNWTTFFDENGSVY